MKSFLKVLKRFSLFIIIILLIICFGFIGYYAYQDMTGSTAKDYIIEKYDFGNFEIFTKKTTVYVYEDDIDCSTLWLKKCTDDNKLAKKVTFITKGKQTIHVIEYQDGTFEDDYTK